jgi:hypothetical protein
MRTKLALAQATESTAADALNLARERAWPDASIRRHASPAVLALLVGAVAAEAFVVAEQVEKRPYVAPPRRPAPKARQAKPKRRAQAKPAFEPKGTVPLTLTRDSERLPATLIIGRTRKKYQGKGVTTEVKVTVGDYTQEFTMSAVQFENLKVSGTRVWVAGKSYIATLVRS